MKHTTNPYIIDASDMSDSYVYAAKKTSMMIISAVYGLLKMNPGEERNNEWYTNLREWATSSSLYSGAENEPACKNVVKYCMNNKAESLKNQSVMGIVRFVSNYEDYTEGKKAYINNKKSKILFDVDKFYSDLFSKKINSNQVDDAMEILKGELQNSLGRDRTI